MAEVQKDRETPLEKELAKLQKLLTPFQHLTDRTLSTLKLQRKHHAHPETIWYDAISHLFGKFKSPVWFKSYVQMLAKHPIQQPILTRYTREQGTAPVPSRAVAPFYFAYGIHMMAGKSVFKVFSDNDNPHLYFDVRGYERLTRKELHWLGVVSVNPEEQSPIVMAIALAEGVPTSMAGKLARTKLSDWPVPAIRMMVKYFKDVDFEREAKQKQQALLQAERDQIIAEYQAAGMVYLAPLPIRYKDRYVQFKIELTIAQLNHLFDYFARGLGPRGTQCNQIVNEGPLMTKLAAWTHPLKKSIQSLQDDAERWTRTTHKIKEASAKTWKGFDLPTIDIVDNKDNPELPYYQFKQLTSGAELAAEGAMLRHCVASYWRDCEQGDLAILSLRQMNPFKAQVTLEVVRRGETYRIVQAAGFGNRAVNSKESELISRYIAELDQFDVDMRYSA